ncbi:TetR/AcrR family transcriptional regulator [Salinifilum ghardaiensis]
MSTGRAGSGRGRPRKIPVERQRELVVDAAVRAFARSGESATIEEVARTAGLTRQSVYELFGGRAELFDAAAQRALDRAVAALSAEVLEPEDEELELVARRSYARMFEFVERQPEVYDVLHVAEQTGRPGLTELCSRLAPVYAAASRRRWEAEGVSSGGADDALVALYFAMTESMVRLSRTDGGPDREALLELLTEFTVGGVTRLLRQSPHVIDRLR